MSRAKWAIVPLLLAAAPALATDLSGTWKITGMVGPVCTLVQKGDALSGSCRGNAGEGAITGTVSGESVQWRWTRVTPSTGISTNLDFSAKLTSPGMTGNIIMGPRKGVFSAVLDAAAANPPPTVIAANSPRTVWDGDLSGTMHHLQSGLECPAAQGTYKRAALLVFDKVGFDVACIYQDAASDARITFYLTKRAPDSMASYFEGEKRAATNNEPKPVPREAIAFAPGANWLKAGFTIPSTGQSLDMFETSLNGWLVNFRATYKPAEAANVTRALANMNSAITASAGTHLAQCQAAPAPIRDGAKLGDDKTKMTAMVLTGALLVRHSLFDAQSSAPIWCAESSFSAGERHFVFWHNISPLDKVGGFVDRITSTDGGPTIDIFSDVGGSSAVRSRDPNASRPVEITDIVIEGTDSVDLIGLFDGKPDMETVARQALNAHEVYAGINRADRKITFHLPS